nr:hypothetical protein [uncultured Campylobacter sp.]
MHKVKFAGLNLHSAAPKMQTNAAAKSAKFTYPRIKIKFRRDPKNKNDD